MREVHKAALQASQHDAQRARHEAQHAQHELVAMGEARATVVATLQVGNIGSTQCTSSEQWKAVDQAQMVCSESVHQ